MSRAERLQAAWADACTRERPEAFQQDLAGFLANHGVHPDDAKDLLAAPRRLGIYRRLVRHNVVDVTHQMLERTRARFEALVPGVFDATVAAFLAEVGPRTPHLRDVPREVLDFAAPRWKADPRVPAWLVDQAEVELVAFSIGFAPRPAPPGDLADVTADRPLVFAEPHAVVRIGHRVHVLPEDDVRAVPEARAAALLVYRDDAHRARFLDLSPLAARILERLLAGDPLGTALVAACTDLGEPLTDAVVAGAAQLLADLGERGVLLGARPL